MSALLSLLLQFIDGISISTPCYLRSVLIFFESELDSKINLYLSIYIPNNKEAKFWPFFVHPFFLVRLSLTTG